MGGGFNGASAVFHWGRLLFKSDAAAQRDATAGEDYATAGRFGKVELQYSRLQSLTRATSFYASISQQLASRNLDSAEKMTLGGPRGVRAYATSEAPSDEGTLLTTELRYWINPNWTVFGLYDWAKGRQQRDVDPLYGDSGNQIYLHGAGFGLTATYPNWATIKATVAWRGSHRPESDSQRNDKPRLYFQAQHTF